jgi:hypothetical protein
LITEFHQADVLTTFFTRHVRRSAAGERFKEATMMIVGIGSIIPIVRDARFHYLRRAIATKTKNLAIEGARFPDKFDPGIVPVVDGTFRTEQGYVLFLGAPGGLNISECAPAQLILRQSQIVSFEMAASNVGAQSLQGTTLIPVSQRMKC